MIVCSQVGVISFPAGAQHALESRGGLRSRGARCHPHPFPSGIWAGEGEATGANANRHSLFPHHPGSGPGSGLKLSPSVCNMAEDRPQAARIPRCPWVPGWGTLSCKAGGCWPTAGGLQAARKNCQLSSQGLFTSAESKASDLCKETKVKNFLAIVWGNNRNRAGNGPANKHHVRSRERPLGHGQEGWDLSTVSPCPQPLPLGHCGPGLPLRVTAVPQASRFF